MASRTASMIIYLTLQYRIDDPNLLITNIIVLSHKGVDTCVGITPKKCPERKKGSRNLRKMLRWVQWFFQSVHSPILLLAFNKRVPD